jgi:hypothetical protein
VIVILQRLFKLDKHVDILSSFIKGFGKRSDADIMNGIFITLMKLELKPLFDFGSRGCLGVESNEIIKILNFNGPLKGGRKYKEFLKAGRLLSPIGSDEIGWAAQYLMDGKKHLYPHEAERAMEIERQFRLSGP